MTTTPKAIYEAGIFRALHPVSLPDGTHVSVILSDAILPERMGAAHLLTMPDSERGRIMQAAAAPFYEADLAFPVAERELTAFSA